METSLSEPEGGLKLKGRGAFKMPVGANSKMTNDKLYAGEVGGDGGDGGGGGREGDGDSKEEYTLIVNMQDLEKTMIRMRSPTCQNEDHHYTPQYP